MKHFLKQDISYSEGRLETGSLTSIIEKTLVEEEYPTAPHTTSPKKSKSLRKKAKKSTSISGKLIGIMEKIKICLPYLNQSNTSAG